MLLILSLLVVCLTLYVRLLRILFVRHGHSDLQEPFPSLKSSSLDVFELSGKIGAVKYGYRSTIFNLKDKENN